MDRRSIRSFGGGVGLGWGGVDYWLGSNIDHGGTVALKVWNHVHWLGDRLLVLGGEELVPPGELLACGLGFGRLVPPVCLPWRATLVNCGASAAEEVVAELKWLIACRFPALLWLLHLVFGGVILPLGEVASPDLINWRALKSSGRCRFWRHGGMGDLSWEWSQECSIICFFCHSSFFFVDS